MERKHRRCFVQCITVWTNSVQKRENIILRGRQVWLPAYPHSVLYNSYLQFQALPLPASPLAGWEGKQANASGWWKTVTKHACPLLLTTFLISPLLSHLQENVNICYTEKMYLLIYVLDKFMLFSRIIKTWLLTTLPFKRKDIFINDFKTWRKGMLALFTFP